VYTSQGGGAAFPLENGHRLPLLATLPQAASYYRLLGMHAVINRSMHYCTPAGDKAATQTPCLVRGAKKSALRESCVHGVLNEVYL
jgi:hypothetical protein